MAGVAPRADVQQRLGRAVQAIRTREGLTQEQVSAAAGLHPTYVSDIERGARTPSWEVLTRLAAGMGVTIGEIGRAYDAREARDRPAARR